MNFIKNIRPLILVGASFLMFLFLELPSPAGTTEIQIPTQVITEVPQQVLTQVLTEVPTQVPVIMMTYYGPVQTLQPRLVPTYVPTYVTRYVPTTVTTDVAGYESSVDNAKFAERAYKTQEMNEWCWAACVSMIFAYYNHPVSQSRIVESVFGGIVDWPASNGRTVAQVLNHAWVDDNNTTFSSTVTAAYDFDANFADLNNATLAAALDNDRPIVIGVGGHAVVMTGIRYTGNIGIPAVVYGIRVFDPWPGRGERWLSKAEMTTMDKFVDNFGDRGQFRFAATVDVN